MLVNEVYRVLKKNGEIEMSMNTSNPTGTYKSQPRHQDALVGDYRFSESSYAGL